MCQSNIHMDSRTQGFPAEHCSKHHCLRRLVFFPKCILVPCVPQISDTYAPGHPRDVKESMIHQTRPPSSIALWSNSDDHVPTVGAFGGGQGSAWAPWLVCGYAAPYATNCDALCILTPFHQNQHRLLEQSYSSSSVGSDHTGQPFLPCPRFTTVPSLDHFW